jgi:hypothetical protein
MEFLFIRGGLLIFLMKRENFLISVVARRTAPRDAGLRRLGGVPNNHLNNPIGMLLW